MARFIKDSSKARGQAPGSLIFIGNQKMEQPIIQIIQYNANNLIEKELHNLKEAYNLINPDYVTWINIYGIHNLELIEQVGDLFKIPSLLIERILNTDARPKYEDGDNYDAFILKMLHKADNVVIAEQITIVLGENFVLSLQEQRGDVFAAIRERIRNSKGRIRRKKSDYLSYSMMDAIIDNYSFITQEIGGDVEEMEDRIFLKKDSGFIEDIYKYKTELNYIRKSIRPVLDLITHLLKSENSFFEENNFKYLHNLNDLVVHTSEAIELYNNMVVDQLNAYNTNSNNRLNEVMKVLTIFASLFIPLTFLAGIYGMNFKYFPELEYKYSYLMFWLVVLTTVIGLLLFFRKKKWL